MIFLHNYLTLIHYPLIPATSLVTRDRSDQNTKEFYDCYSQQCKSKIDKTMYNVYSILYSSLRVRLIKVKFKVFVPCWRHQVLRISSSTLISNILSLQYNTVQHSTVQHTTVQLFILAVNIIVISNLISNILSVLSELKKDQSLFAVQI